MLVIIVKIGNIVPVVNVLIFASQLFVLKEQFV